MARSIKCPHCGQVMKVREQAAGKRVDCPVCKKAFLAPKALAVTPTEKPTEAIKTGGPPLASTAPRVWYFHVDGRNDGPHTPETVVEQIKTGRLDAQTLVWREGMGDWRPLKELPEFRGALAAPPPVSATRVHKAHDPNAPDYRGHGSDREPRAHYSREKAKRDAAVGLWIAGGLGFAVLVTLVVVLSRKDQDTKPALQPPPPQPEVQPPEPLPTTPPEAKGKTAPAPRPKAGASNPALLAALVAELDRSFKAAIDGHKKAQVKPILSLARKCKTHADKLAERDWGGYKPEVESLIKQLNHASQGIQNTVKERCDNWSMGEGLDFKQKEASMGLSKFEWITNWERILTDEIGKVRKRGLDF